MLSSHYTVGPPSRILNQSLSHLRLTNIGKLTHDELDARILSDVASNSSPCGFINNTDTTLAFDNPTRTLTIAPTTGNVFDVIIHGITHVKYTLTFQISDVYGLHRIYFDENGNLQETLLENDIIFTEAYVAVIGWDNTTSKYHYFGDERHGASMEPMSHKYIHLSIGCAYLGGLALDSIIADGGGSLDSHVQFATFTGDILDEDLQHTITAVPSTQGYYVYSRDGVSKWQRSSTLTFMNNTTRMNYNYNNAGSWEQKEATNNYYLCQHVFATNSAITNEQIIIVQGQEEYKNLLEGTEGSISELNALILSGTLEFEEFRPIATILYKTNSAYTNSYKTQIVTNNNGDTWVDWRYSGSLVSGSGGGSGIDITAFYNDYISKVNQEVLTTSTPTFEGIIPYTTSDFEIGSTLIINDTTKAVGINTNPNYTFHNVSNTTQGAVFDDSTGLNRFLIQQITGHANLQSLGPGGSSYNELRLNNLGGDLYLGSSNEIFIDHTNHYTGINTALPNYSLDVSGTCHISDVLTTTADVNLSGSLIYIDETNGRVGFSTSSPTVKHHFTDNDFMYIDGVADNRLIINNSVGGTVISCLASSDSTPQNLVFQFGGGTVQFGTQAGMFDCNNQRLGIKNNTPSYELDVNGQIHAVGNIIADSLIDGVDLAAFKTDYDSKIDQAVKEASSPEFAGLDLRAGDYVMNLQCISDFGLIQVINDNLTTYHTLKINNTGGDVDISDGKLYVDESADRVGFGTKTPGYTHHITGINGANFVIDNTDTRFFTQLTDNDATYGDNTNLQSYNTTGTSSTLMRLQGIGGNLIVGSNNVLTVNNTTKRIGINNGGPSYDLDVSGTMRIIGNSLITGSITQTGAYTIVGDVGQTGDITHTGDIDQTGDTVQTGTQTIDSSLSTSSDGVIYVKQTNTSSGSGSCIKFSQANTTGHVFDFSNCTVHSVPMLFTTSNIPVIDAAGNTRFIRLWKS